MKLMDKFKRDQYRVSTCVESVCRPHLRHGDCLECGARTDNSKVGIEEGTLRRRKMYICGRCIFESDSFRERQEELRELRTKRDWERVTDPITQENIRVSMPEQYASKARATVRAFASSEFEFAAASGSDPATLAQTINTLGLADEIYVETRNGETILRKVSNV